MKRWKKIVLLVLSFNLLFFAVESKKRETEATGAEIGAAMSIGQLIASGVTGSALAPFLVGAAGAAAIYATITNWDTIKAYGSEVLNTLNAKGIATESVVNTEDYTVQLTPDVVNSFATSVDKVPAKIYPLSGGVSLPDIKKDWSVSSANYYTVYNLSQKIEPVALPKGTYYVIGDIPNIYLRGTEQNSLNVKYTNAIGNSQSGTTLVTSSDGLHAYRFTLTSDSTLTEFWGGGGVYSVPVTPLAIYNARLVSEAEYLQLKAVSTAETFGATAATPEEREAVANANINGAQAIALPLNGELQGATWANIANPATPADPDETVETPTETLGWLDKIWKAITSLPTNIAAAFAAFFKTITDTMRGLWEDAGKVWSGMAADVQEAKGILNNILTGALENIRSGIDALSGALAGWFDNIRGGIDALSGALAGWMDGVLSGIETGVRTLADGLAAVGARVLDLPNILAEDLAELKALVVPTDLAMSDYTAKMDELRGRFDKKFEFITIPVQSLKGLFASPKSLYDVSFEVMGERIYVLPRMLAPAVDIIRPVLTGAAVVSTFIFIYRKFSPDEVVA